MKKILFCILILCCQYALSAKDCYKDLDYQRNIVKHENDIRLMRIAFREKLIDKCPRSKLKSKYCKVQIKRFEKQVAQKNDDFLLSPLNKKCAKETKDISKVSRSLHIKTNKSGFFNSGIYRENSKCEDSQQAAQVCRDVKKVLSSCKIQNRHLLVKCVKRTKSNSNNICYEASPILSLLTSEYSVCQVSIKDLDKFAPCLAQSAKENRARLCPNGCASKPNKKMCDWSEEEINNYLGCLQIANREQYEHLCPNRVKVETPTEAKVPALVKGCENTYYSGKIKPWNILLSNKWPEKMNAAKFIKTSAKPRRFLSLAISVKKDRFVKTPEEGDDFVEEGESTELKARGSGVFYVYEAPGYVGAKEISLSQCPGQFSEDSLDANCVKSYNKNGKIAWEFNPQTDDVCKLEANKRYYLNIRFNRGCNWKNACGVKVKHKLN